MNKDLINWSCHCLLPRGMFYQHGLRIEEVHDSTIEDLYEKVFCKSRSPAAATFGSFWHWQHSQSWQTPSRKTSCIPCEICNIQILKPWIQGQICSLPGCSTWRASFCVCLWRSYSAESQTALPCEKANRVKGNSLIAGQRADKY